jgi:3-hydroxyacyl-CoA dehydrogenase/3-hydroxy-2-methylbutyryl-CoA dehydrogenase
MSHISNSIRGSLNVITGCANGLGKATLERFLRHGSGPILAIDRRFGPQFLDQLDVNDEERKKVVLAEHDTFDESKTASSLKSFANENGSIDNLINVAGVALAFTFFSEASDPTKHKIYDLRHANDLLNFNTVGTFNMIRLAAQYMIDTDIKEQVNRDKRSKCIVNTSCISTTKPSFGQTFYAASKSAIDSLTLCIAREFSTANIRCNTINVGYFDTQLLRSSDARVCDYIANEKTLCPKRLGHPDEFAHLVQSVVENRMLNGACIKIDAGAEPAQDKSASRNSGQL